MIWTWQQRMYRAIARFELSGDLSDEEVIAVCRAPYFGQFRWALHFSPPLNNITSYDDLHDEITANVLPQASSRLTGIRAIFQFNLFGDGPELLNALHPFRSEGLTPGRLLFNSLHVIEERCWHWRLPPVKPKGLYYSKFRYRIEFSDKKWAKKEENIKTLERISGAFVPSRSQRNYLYCVDERDVIIAKCLFGEDILRISERTPVTDPHNMG